MPDQIAQCRAHCDRNGWEVVEVFSEPGASALDEDRRVFQELIHKATKPERPFQFVVVHSLSRFSRDAMHSEMYVRQLRKSRVEIVSITQDVGNDPSGQLFRKMLNIIDEHSSKENAKHTHRAMCENTRQGFWNGSHAPYGYKIEIKERRGNKDKKVLVVDEEEARIVRLMFDKASGAEGRPVGVKAIACWFNDRGFLRRGKKFSTGSIHKLLTSTTYCGQHYFNRTDSREGTRRPPSEWVGLPVPAIISESTFNVVQVLLQSRAPSCVPPRVVNGPTFLAGLARCGYCDSALVKNTGKRGAYSYYACSRHQKEGPTSCSGMRMPMKKLDDIVVTEISRRILEPTRLEAMLEIYVKSATERGGQDKDRLAKLRKADKEAEEGLKRLIRLVESGAMEAEDGALKERLTSLKLQRTELARDISEQRERISSGEPVITPEKIARIASLLRDKLSTGPADLKQAYARVLMESVHVTKEEIRISGSKDVLARAASDGMETATPAVLSFVRDWRAILPTGQDETANRAAHGRGVNDTLGTCSIALRRTSNVISMAA